VHDGIVLVYMPQEGQITMAIVKSSANVNKSTQNVSKEDQMAASSTHRYEVIQLSGKSRNGEEWAAYYLIVKPEAPLSEKEMAALLDVFDIAVAGKPRKNFERKFFRGMTAILAKAGMVGGHMYWLADDSMMDLAQAKENVVETLGKAKAGKPTAQQPQGDAVRGKAASKAGKAKDAAKNKAAKRQAAYEVVLG
jgi:hypothetical protein